MYALIERIIEVFYHLYVIAYNNQTRVFDRKLREICHSERVPRKALFQPTMRGPRIKMITNKQ